jgi:hypothetical protein
VVSITCCWVKARTSSHWWLGRERCCFLGMASQKVNHHIQQVTLISVI